MAWSVNIGFSNFTLALLDKAWRLTTEPFAVEQLEYHPYLDQSKMLAALRKRGMAITAYCPIALGKVVGDPVIEVHRCRPPAQRGADHFARGWCSSPTS